MQVSMLRLIKRLEPHAGGYILRISASEIEALGLQAGERLEVQLWPSVGTDAESLLRR